MKAPVPLVVSFDASELGQILDAMAAEVAQPGECDQPCCTELRVRFAEALRSAARAMKPGDVAVELPAAVEASDADADTPHRFESER